MKWFLSVVLLLMSSVAYAMPTQVSVDAWDIRCRTLNVRWTASSDPNGIREYWIFRDGHFQDVRGGNLLQSTMGRFLWPGEIYSWTVQAVSNTGEVGPMSAPYI